ncbi:hypothetical protein [Vibrio diazotrophicus]|uniref:hypothetical protein n=1 Tax=Vibrio diazotrophicus TaxID=685 RepID=UPI000C9E32AB|nr:hypothetical protein [Vibrio diazotrophicus]PNH97366.1 hypothetical protein C1O24_06450 [Vibrio diazotrophicus]
MTKLYKTISFLFAPVLSVIGAIFYFAQIPDFCCDVYQYIHIAQSFDQNGFVFSHSGSDIRNYLYPFFLSIVAKGSIYSITDFLHFSKLSLVVTVFFSALIFNYSSYIWLKSRCLSSVCTIFLFFNPLLATIYTLPLTEMFVFPLFVVFISLANLAIHFQGNMVRNSLIFFFFLLLSILVLLRPANIVLIVPVFLFSIYLVIYRQFNFSIIMLGVIVFFIPFIPQVIFNLKVFGNFSFLPVGGLGGKQFLWGLMYSKYGTFFVDDHAGGLKYNSFLNKDIIEKYKENGLLYYLFEFPQSIFLLCSHLFNSLNYDFLYTYVNKKEYYILSWYQILSSLMTVTGMGYSWVLLRSLYSFKHRVFEYFLLIILCVFLGMNSFVAVETRFGMIPHLIFTIFSIRLFCNKGLVNKYISFPVFIIIGAGYIVLSIYFSYYFVMELDGVSIKVF